MEMMLGRCLAIVDLGPSPAPMISRSDLFKPMSGCSRVRSVRQICCSRASFFITGPSILQRRRLFILAQRCLEHVAT